jgi:hypothetical protein
MPLSFSRKIRLALAGVEIPSGRTLQTQEEERMDLSDKRTGPDIRLA